MSSQDEEPAEERAFDYARTVSLSDCVFSIAMTLLVLNITVPMLSAGQHSQLGQRLLDQHQQFEAYGISFAVIALLWVRHHALFRGLDRIDGTVTALNLIYLGFVAFLPFPTRVLATYTNEPASVALYAATGAVVSGIASLVRLHAIRADLLSPFGVREVARREHPAFPPLIFLGSIPIAFVVPRVAAYLWLLLVLMPLTHRWRARDAP
jgi:TMEM175 potassium channel family protein